MASPETVSSSAFSELYRETVLTHARAPRGGGVLEGATARAEAKNALCGDHVSVTLRLDADERIDALRHVTDGCLLCTASASLMAACATGLHAEDISGLRAGLETLLAGGEPDAALGALGALAGAAAYPSRHRCVLLPWEALSGALCDATTLAPGHRA